MANEQSSAKVTCDEVQPLLREATRGGLDAATRALVYEHLATCPECTKLAEEERALDRSLDALPQYPAPLALKRRLRQRLAPLAERPAQRRRLAVSRWLGPAALAVAACLVLVFSLRQPPMATGQSLVSESVANHLRVVYREQPTDVASGGPHQVKPWFTGRLDFALPSVFGGDDDFSLEGGSVGYYLDRKAAVLVYKQRLHTLSLFVFRAEGVTFPRGDHDVDDRSIAERDERGFHVLLWRDGDLGYSLVSDLNVPEMLRLADDIVQRK